MRAPRRHLSCEGQLLERRLEGSPDSRMRKGNLTEATAGVGDRNEHGTVGEGVAPERVIVLPSFGTGIRDKLEDFVEDFDGEAQERAAVVVCLAEDYGGLGQSIIDGFDLKDSGQTFKQDAV